jgi:hypothetical protein
MEGFGIELCVSRIRVCHLHSFMVSYRGIGNRAMRVTYKGVLPPLFGKRWRD